MWTVDFYITLGSNVTVDHTGRYDRYEHVDAACKNWLDNDVTYINFGIRCRSCKIHSDSAYFYEDGLMYADARAM